MVHATKKPSKQHHSSPRRRRAASSTRSSRVASAYKSANTEYKALVRYLRTAVGVLPKAECQLLLKFAENAKRKCERLLRALRPCSKPTASWSAAPAVRS